MNPKISTEEILRQIRQKKKAEKIAGLIVQNPEVITDLIELMKTEKGTIKFSCEKILRLLSEQSPEIVYPYFDDLADLLDSDNNFIKWGVIITIANLTAVDREDKFEKLFDKYYSPLSGPVMITAANIIKSSPKIARAKPQLTDRITEEILNTQSARYINDGVISPECKNIVFGHAIDSLAQFFDKIQDTAPVVEFIEKQRKNSRPAVVKKAEKFLKKLNKTHNK